MLSFCYTLLWIESYVQTFLFSSNIWYKRNLFFFSFLDPPNSDPVILTNTSNFEFDDGARVTLICELNGGNPLATLDFKCNDFIGKDVNDGNKKAVSVLSVVVDKSYNNKQCSCLANHQLFNSSRSETKTLTVFCKYLIEIFSKSWLNISLWKEANTRTIITYCNC